MSLIVEDGTAKTDAQSYAAVATADTYLAAHASASTWAAKNTQQKEALLIQATRSIDAFVTFAGYKVSALQALQWPRQNVPWKGPLPTVEGQPAPVSSLEHYPSNRIPPELVAATCEAAAYCMANTPGGQWDGAGLKSVSLGDGAIDVSFDATSRPPELPPMITAVLRPFTTGNGSGRGTIRIRRA